MRAMVTTESCLSMGSVAIMSGWRVRIKSVMLQPWNAAARSEQISVLVSTCEWAACEDRSSGGMTRCRPFDPARTACGTVFKALNQFSRLAMRHDQSIRSPPASLLMARLLAIHGNEDLRTGPRHNEAGVDDTT